MEEEQVAKNNIHNYFPNFDSKTFADALIMLTMAGVSGYVPLETVAKAFWFVHEAKIHPDYMGFEYEEVGSYKFKYSQK